MLMVVNYPNKHAVLSTQPCLITSGLFFRSRNPNYFGEMLIYLRFAVMAMRWWVLIPLAY